MERKDGSKISWKTVLRVSGAFTAYQIGAGFASGQEAMQYLGTFGGVYPYVLPVIMAVLVAIYCVSSYRASFDVDFQNPNDAYAYFCGKRVGALINIFANIVIALTSLLMFAGCGETIHQYLHIPVWVGAVSVGILSAVVVCLGLEKVVDVLGVCGILIIVIIAVAGISSVFRADAGLMESQRHVSEYVAQGLLLQVSVFGSTNPFLVCFSFVGMGLSLVLTFNVSLGKSCRNRREYIAAGIVSAVFFFVGVCMVLFAILLNLDEIASQGAKVFMLAAIEKVIPWMTLPYTVIICIGIFTTIVGYLWMVGRRFGEDGTLRQRAVVILMTVIGITVGSLIPLDSLVNAILPIASYVGMFLFLCMIVTDVRKWRARRKGRREGAAGQE